MPLPRHTQGAEVSSAPATRHELTRDHERHEPRAQQSKRRRRRHHLGRRDRSFRNTRLFVAGRATLKLERELAEVNGPAGHEAIAEREGEQILLGRLEAAASSAAVARRGGVGAKFH